MIHWKKLRLIAKEIQKGMTQLKTVIIAGKVEAITSTMRFLMATKKSLMRMVTLWI